MQQKAWATFGQLFHNNTIYHEQVIEAWYKKKRRKRRLPSIPIKFINLKDFGTPVLDVEVNHYSLPRIPIDGSFGVNIMIGSTAFDLDFTKF